MAGTLTVKIAVSCHKPIACPNSDLYLPVQLGASTAKIPIEGMQPDNAGDNISFANFSFSEMTAQYWAWKNLEADYVGLCHYRRYFCFDGLEHQKNDHAQIEIPCLSPLSATEYHLDDDELIISAVAVGVIAYRNPVLDNEWIGYNSPLVALMTMAIFNIFEDIKLQENDLLWKIDRLCFGVYLIHPLFIQFTYRVLGITPMKFGITWIGTIVLFVFFVACSFAFSYIASLIKPLKKYVL